MDITSLSETDDEEDSGEDSDSSEDGMKPSQKHQQDAQAKQALDKDPISLIPPFEQAANESLAKELGQRTG